MSALLRLAEELDLQPFDYSYLPAAIISFDVSPSLPPSSTLGPTATPTPGFASSPSSFLPPSPSPRPIIMPPYPAEQIKIYKALCGTIPSIVFLVTCFRLWCKGRARLWWDDGFAVLGVTFMIAQQALLWGSTSFTTGPSLPVFYLVMICTFSQVFSARLSILFSVIKIAPTSRTRTVAQCIGVFFLFLWILLIAQIFWVCAGNTKFVAAIDLPVCNLTKEVPILQFAVAMIADALLILMPLRTLRLLKGDQILRRRLVIIFLASIITTLASLTQSITNLLQNQFGLLVTASLEAWVSLLVMNLGVVVNAVIKRFFPSMYRSTTVTNMEISILKSRQTTVSGSGIMPFSPVTGSPTTTVGGGVGGGLDTRFNGLIPALGLNGNLSGDSMKGLAIREEDESETNVRNIGYKQGETKNSFWV